MPSSYRYRRGFSVRRASMTCGSGFMARVTKYLTRCKGPELCDAPPIGARVGRCEEEERSLLVERLGCEHEDEALTAETRDSGDNEGLPLVVESRRGWAERRLLPVATVRGGDGALEGFG